MMLPRVLEQDQVWVNGERLDEMDRHHRANLIPFLRGNARTLQRMAERIYWGSSLAAVDWLEASDGVAGAQAEAEAQFELPADDWLERTPLMRRLVELEAGRPIDERRETFERNQEFERATGYQKVRLG